MNEIGLTTENMIRATSPSSYRLNLTGERLLLLFVIKNSLIGEHKITLAPGYG